MGVGSDTTGALHEMVRIPRIAPLEDYFDAPEHLPRTPGILDLATLDLNFDPEVAFYSRNRIYDDSFCHIGSSRCSL
jgi:hypothetical protein